MTHTLKHNTHTCNWKAPHVIIFSPYVSMLGQLILLIAAPPNDVTHMRNEIVRCAKTSQLCVGLRNCENLGHIFQSLIFLAYGFEKRGSFLLAHPVLMYFLWVRGDSKTEASPLTLTEFCDCITGGGTPLLLPPSTEFWGFTGEELFAFASSSPIGAARPLQLIDHDTWKQ